MLLVGGLIVPIVGWFVGVVLLWVSNAWNVRDKVIGTLFVPGGLGLSFFLLFVGLSASGGGSSISGCQIDPGTGREFNCFEESTTDPTSFTDVLAIVFLVALVVAPIITTAYLTHRLRRQPAAATA